jgi:hypothetical protein
VLLAIEYIPGIPDPLIGQFQHDATFLTTEEQ